MRQLTLNLHLSEKITFDNFIVGENLELMSALKNLFSNDEFCWYLWGEQSVGRTHLLQACANYASQLQKKAMYVALSDYVNLSPDIVRGMDQYDIVLWDDVDSIAGLNEWEVALFHAYNQLQSAGSKLICTASMSPLSCQIQLPDFRSRLAAGVTYQIKPLCDEDKLTALQQRANLRGMQLSDSVGHYMLSHCSRNLSDLFALLDKLDSASLEEKRLLTVPFVKTVLS